MQDVTFHNVTITINAADGASAYTALAMPSARWKASG
jgi:hypothetical protein